MTDPTDMNDTEDTEDTDDTSLDIWALLEADAPDGCDDVQDLYSWSLNYDAGKGPFTLLLDLIGWSEDNIGEPMFDLRASHLGYLECAKLGAALTAYADRPQDVKEYIDQLMEAEARS